MARTSMVVATLISVMLLFVTVAIPAQDCPEPVGRWLFGPTADVAASGNLAVFGSGPSIVLADISDPTHPTRLGSLAFEHVV